MNLEDLGTWWHEALAATTSDRTRRLYLEAVTRLIAWMGSNGVKTSEPPSHVVLNRYFGEFRRSTSVRTGRPLSASYVNQHFRSLQQFYKWLESEELITKNPFTKMKQPRIPDSPVPVFSDLELARMFKETAGSDPRSRRDRAIVRLLLDTGCRVGELCGIRISDVDFAQKTVLVKGKGSHARNVPFNSKAYTELRRWLLVRPETKSDKLFVGLRGRNEPLTESGVRQLLNKLGVEDPHPHRFRHTAAHLWLANGGLETDLRRLMGWRSESMVYRYAASAGVERAVESSRRMALADKY